MPHISKISSSRFLKVADVKEGPITVTVKSCGEENVAMQNQPPEEKWVVRFHEVNGGLVVGETIKALMAMATGSEYTEEWIGKKVVLYNDPTVMFGTTPTGGVRVRAEGNPIPAQTPPPAQVPSPAPPLGQNPHQEYANPNPDYDPSRPTPADDSDDPLF